ncbi:putative acyl-CoA thioesterase YneP [Flavobacteriaceae bacterium UJ101]|nr:putative acyl-CoA thioesterase YneP [Flavobacteriaceae bacterium UJ101]
MIKNRINIRVRYSETDQMGFVYYGNYAQYFEVARVELFRGLGISYKSLEEDGIWMPVLNLNIQYIRPAVYDDLLSIEVSISEIKGSRIIFDYKIYNEEEVLLNTAQTTLIFMNAETKRPTRCPEILLEKVGL